MNLQELRESSDWQHIFNHYCHNPNPCVSLLREDGVIDRKFIELVPIQEVVRIIAVEDGENDGAEWLGVFECLTPGRAVNRFLAVRAGCDYTGWGCQEGGESFTAETLEDIIQYGLTDAERERLKHQLENAS